MEFCINRLGLRQLAHEHLCATMKAVQTEMANSARMKTFAIITGVTVKDSYTPIVAEVFINILGRLWPKQQEIQERLGDGTKPCLATWKRVHSTITATFMTDHLWNLTFVKDKACARSWTPRAQHALHNALMALTRPAGSTTTATAFGLQGEAFNDLTLVLDVDQVLLVAVQAWIKQIELAWLQIEAAPRATVKSRAGDGSQLMSRYRNLTDAASSQFQGATADVLPPYSRREGGCVLKGVQMYGVEWELINATFRWAVPR